MNFAQFSMVCRVFFSLRAEMEGGAVEGASLVASFASESAHSFPRMSECPGHHGQGVGQAGTGSLLSRLIGGELQVLKASRVSGLDSRDVEMR